MTYVAIINVPGYLGTDNDPPVFDTASEAWWYLYHERCDAEREAPCDLCDDTMSHGPSGDCDDDSETAMELAKIAKSMMRTGTIYGPTPGYRGDHDLGVAYSVEVEES